MQQCIDQISEMPATIADMLDLSATSEEMAANYEHCLREARGIWDLSEELLPVLRELADEARGFWLCCPLDHVKVWPPPLHTHLTALQPTLECCFSPITSPAPRCGTYMWVG